MNIRMQLFDWFYRWINQRNALSEAIRDRAYIQLWLTGSQRIPSLRFNWTERDEITFDRRHLNVLHILVQSPTASFEM